MIDKFTDIYILTPENIIIYKQFKLIFMKHQFFYKRQLLLMEKEGKIMLYHFPLCGNEMSKMSALEPVEFIGAPQKRILLDDDAGLLVTDEDIYTLDGEKLLHAPNLTNIKIERRNVITAIQADNEVEKCKEFILFLDKTLLLHEKCKEIRQSRFYFALLKNDEWGIYDWCGNIKNIKYPLLYGKDELCIRGRFLIKTGMVKHELYSLTEEKVIRTDQNVILCSEVHNFAICASLGSDLQVYSNGQWYNFADVTFFDIIDDIAVFYMQKDGKYYVFGYNGGIHACSVEGGLSNGVDFVSYDAQSRTVVWIEQDAMHMHTVPNGEFL